MSEGDRSAEELLGLFGDESTRRLLLATSEGPMSAEELSERLGVSRTTVYRRVNRLEPYDLLHESLRTDDRGHHYRVFETAVNELTFAIDDGELTISVSVEDGLDERFEGFMDGMGESARRVSREVNERPDQFDPREGPHHG